MLFLCFEPEPMLIKVLKPVDRSQTKAQRPSPLGTEDAIFGVNSFGTTNPLLGHYGTQSISPLLFAQRLCAPDVKG